MSAFRFKTQGIDAGCSENGFFAFGQTEDFDLEENLGDCAPSIRGALNWAIRTNHEGDAWKHYQDAMDANRMAVTLREAEIRKVLGARPLLGLFWRFVPENLSLEFYLPPDPALISLVMGMIAAGRQMDFTCGGFYFAGGEDAAAPSVSGFMDRKEPLFIAEYPTLRVAEVQQQHEKRERYDARQWAAAVGALMVAGGVFWLEREMNIPITEAALIAGLIGVGLWNLSRSWSGDDGDTDGAAFRDKTTARWRARRAKLW